MHIPPLHVVVKSAERHCNEGIFQLNLARVQGPSEVPMYAGHKKADEVTRSPIIYSLQGCNIKI